MFLRRCCVLLLSCFSNSTGDNNTARSWISNRKLDSFTRGYHFSREPRLFLERLRIALKPMNLIGDAVDRYPISYSAAYKLSSDDHSEVAAMTSGGRLKQGNRSDDGITAPADTLNSLYSNECEFIDRFGRMPQESGRTGQTLESPYDRCYYIIKAMFLSIPCCFRGMPSVDFKRIS